MGGDWWQRCMHSPKKNLLMSYWQNKKEKKTIYTQARDACVSSLCLSSFSSSSVVVVVAGGGWWWRCTYSPIKMLLVSLQKEKRKKDYHIGASGYRLHCGSLLLHSHREWWQVVVAVHSISVNNHQLQYKNQKEKKTYQELETRMCLESHSSSLSLSSSLVVYQVPTATC